MFLVVVLKPLFAMQEYPPIATEEIPKPLTVLSTDTLLDCLLEKSLPSASTAISPPLNTVPATAKVRKSDK